MEINQLKSMMMTSQSHFCPIKQSEFKKINLKSRFLKLHMRRSLLLADLTCTDPSVPPETTGGRPGKQIEEEVTRSCIGRKMATQTGTHAGKQKQPHGPAPPCGQPSLHKVHNRTEC